MSKPNSYNLLSRILLFVVAVGILAYIGLSEYGYNLGNYDITITALGQDITFIVFAVVGVVITIIAGTFLRSAQGVR